MNELRRLVAIILLAGAMIAVNASSVSYEPITMIQDKPINSRVHTIKAKVKSTQTKVTRQALKQVRTFRVTAYTGIDRGESGRDITASGTKAVPYQTVAASKDMPFGTVLIDVKTGHRYIVEDRGGAIKGNSLDLYVGNSNVKAALQFGVKYMTLEIEK